VDLRHADEKKNSPVVDIGIDLSEFYQSVEWDILEVPAERFLNLANRRNSRYCIYITCGLG
jgi:hypothetical protein